MRVGGRRLDQAGRGNSGLLWLLLLLAAAVCAWWWYAPASIPTVVREQLPKTLQPPPPNPLLYKWQDDQGHWNISDQPPEGRKYEAVRVDPNTNVLPSGVPPEKDSSQ